MRLSEFIVVGGMVYHPNKQNGLKRLILNNSKKSFCRLLTQFQKLSLEFALLKNKCYLCTNKIQTKKQQENGSTSKSNRNPRTANFLG